MQYYDFPTCQNLSHVHIPTSKGQKKKKYEVLAGTRQAAFILLNLAERQQLPPVGKGAEFPAWQLHGWTLEPLKMVELSRM
mgnify:CR=1 FL=1